MNDWNIERRIEPRKKLMAFVPVYFTSGNSLLGFLADLTMNGAQIIGEKPLEPGAQEMLSFKLPDDLPKIKAGRMDILVRVMRCEPDHEGKDSYRIGLLFLEPDPDNEAIIQALLERYHFRYKGEIFP